MRRWHLDAVRCKLWRLHEWLSGLTDGHGAIVPLFLDLIYEFESDMIVDGPSIIGRG